MAAVHDSECAELRLRAQEQERWLTVLALSDFANTSDERPAEGRAARDDEGLRTHERATGKPTAEGRTAPHDDSCLDGNEERRLAHNVTPSNATGQGTRTTNNEFRASSVAFDDCGQVRIAGI